MKNWTVLDWVLFMLGAAVALDLVFCIAVPAVLGIPTTDANRELRKELIGMLNDITIAIIAIVALKYKEVNNQK